VHGQSGLIVQQHVIRVYKLDNVSAIIPYRQTLVSFVTGVQWTSFFVTSSTVHVRLNNTTSVSVLSYVVIPM
jgi:hypothetical protein